MNISGEKNQLPLDHSKMLPSWHHETTCERITWSLISCEIDAHIIYSRSSDCLLVEQCSKIKDLLSRRINHGYYHVTIRKYGTRSSRCLQMHVLSFRVIKKTHLHTSVSNASAKECLMDCSSAPIVCWLKELSTKAHTLQVYFPSYLTDVAQGWNRKVSPVISLYICAWGESKTNELLYASINWLGHFKVWKCKNQGHWKSLQEIRPTPYHPLKTCQVWKVKKRSDRKKKKWNCKKPES